MVRKHALRGCAALLVGLSAMSAVSGLPKDNHLYSAADMRDDCRIAFKCIESKTNECQSKTPAMVRTATCTSFVRGFMTGRAAGLVEIARGHSVGLGADLDRFLNKYSIACVPNRISDREVTEAFLKYVREHPEYLNESAAEIFFFALAAKWPCMASDH